MLLLLQFFHGLRNVGGGVVEGESFVVKKQTGATSFEGSKHIQRSDSIFQAAFLVIPLWSPYMQILNS